MASSPYAAWLWQAMQPPNSPVFNPQAPINPAQGLSGGYANPIGQQLSPVFNPQAPRNPAQGLTGGRRNPVQPQNSPVFNPKKRSQFFGE